MLPVPTRLSGQIASEQIADLLKANVIWLTDFQVTYVYVNF